LELIRKTNTGDHAQLTPKKIWSYKALALGGLPDGSKKRWKTPSKIMAITNTPRLFCSGPKKARCGGLETYEEALKAYDNHWD